MGQSLSTNTLLVRHISQNISYPTINAIFGSCERHGLCRVSKFVITKGKYEKKFYLIEYDDGRDALDALNSINGLIINGEKIHVERIEKLFFEERE